MMFKKIILISIVALVLVISGGTISFSDDTAIEELEEFSPSMEDMEFKNPYLQYSDNAN